MINTKEQIIKYFQSGVKDQKNFKIGTKYTRNSEPGNLFNFEGCVWTIKWEDALKICQKKFLADLAALSIKTKGFSLFLVILLSISFDFADPLIYKSI